MRKIRVLRLIARMNLGGPAIQITGLMMKLPSEQFEQVLVTGYCDPDEVDYLELNGFQFPLLKIEGFGRRINLFSDLKTLLAIRRIIKDFDPDIIHTHTAKAGFLGRVAAISTLKKQIRIHTFHGHLLHGYFGTFITRLVIFVERTLANFTDKFVAVGNQVRDELLSAKIGELDKFKVIGPGLTMGKLPERNTSLEFFLLPQDKFIVTWIGRVVAIKAPHRILEIAMQCSRQGSNVHFVVVGEGPLLSELKHSAMCLNLPLTFIGWQSDIEKVLSFSDLVLLTSKNEGTPVALIQAQMAGVPVLTSDVGSASEVVINQKSGYCLDYSAEQFANKIKFLAQNVEVKKDFGVNGKTFAEKNFSLERLVSDHNELYNQLISQSRSSPTTRA